MLMLVGTYTRKTRSEGIYAFDFDQDSIDLRQSCVNQGIDNPSYLIKHPRLDVVYAVNEVRDYLGEDGAISAFHLDGQGKLELINQICSMGADPCHLEISSTGKSIFVSNYSSGTLAVFPIAEQGALKDFMSFVQHTGQSVDPMRQKSAHVHSIKLDEQEKYAYVADLGLDKLIRYPVDGAGQVRTQERKSIRIKTGAGPRHFIFDASHEYCYLINELDNTIVSLGVNDDGSLTEMATVGTLPSGYTDASYCAEIQLSADGRFLYGSNRGHDSIVVFETKDQGGLQLVQHIPSEGRHPRHFKITPDGNFLIVANRDSNNVVVLSVDLESGKLSATGKSVAVPSPVYVLFL